MITFDLIKEHSGWIISILSILLLIFQHISNKNKAAAETIKVNAETGKIAIENKQNIAEQLDTAWDNNVALRAKVLEVTDTLQKCMDEIERQREEIEYLKKKLSVYSSFDALIQQERDNQLNRHNDTN